MMHKKGLRNLKRRKNFRVLRKIFLIVCEGEKTEPNYFKGFRVSKRIIDIYGVGDNTENLVRKAIEIRDNDGTSYDEVWCVFDRDSFPVQNFNNALSIANRNNIQVAYSNEAFEIWYILHFYYHDTATSRNQYKRMVTDRLGFEYKKNDPNIYEQIIGMQENAIMNAKRLLNSYPNPNPAIDNPSTKVHLLVSQLKRYSV